MAYKDIMLYLDDSKASAKHMDAAISFAKAQDAHLAGLALDARTSVGSYLEANIPQDVVHLVREREHERAETIAGSFRAAATQAGFTDDCRIVQCLDVDAAETIGEMARYADLLVMGQIDQDDTVPTGGRELVEDVVLTSGRPTLVIPYIGVSQPIGKKVLVAWDASREAARAVADAMPVLETAETVTVFMVNPKVGEGAHGEEPGADIALHLARHKIPVQVDHTETRDISAADAILAYAADHDIDLIVMGAYGHSRLREVILGGVTRQIMRQMPVPVLLSH